MKLQKIDGIFSVCKIEPNAAVEALLPPNRQHSGTDRQNPGSNRQNFRSNRDKCSDELFFLAKTGDELSLVCPADSVPACALMREDGFAALRVAGTLDFSLIGILSELTGILARQKIGVFVVSTFDTDYVLVREPDFPKAVRALSEEGYEWI